MRITSANNPYQAGKAGSSSAVQSSDRANLSQQVDAKGGRYSKTPEKSSPQIIEAEYVEVYNPPAENNYSPSPLNFALERVALDNRIESGGSKSDLSSSDLAAEPASTKTAPYSLNPHHAPPPGTYIDIIA